MKCVIMGLLRYNYITVLTIFVIIGNDAKYIGENEPTVEHTTHNCPFTRFIEDIFKLNKTTNSGTKDSGNTKHYLDTVDNLDRSNSNKTNEELINTIIASIKRIKENLTNTDPQLNEAIILNSNNIINKNNISKAGQIKSGIEDKNDMKSYKNDTIQENKTNYIEILTIEPNNTTVNNKSTHILDVIKKIVPIFNKTALQDLHSTTLTEQKPDNNQSLAELKNISTDVLKNCDKNNLTNIKHHHVLENFKPIINESVQYDEYLEEYNDDDQISRNFTKSSKDVLEAAEYGMQKMHELYGVLEPKLYSMGLWLDDKDPARYVAAFNAPSEDITRYSKYGYASLQAAAKLKELTSDGDALESRTEGQRFPTVSALRQSPLLDACPLRGPPKCPPASKRYRTHDGTCNNLNRPRWGSTMTPVQRFIQPVYSDDIQAPRRSVFGSNLPSAREISAVVHEDKNAESIDITHLLMQWGQLIDHDITASSQSRGFNGSVPRCCVDGGRDFVPKEFMHPECFPIAVPDSDPFYGPRGVRCLDFVRSSPAPRDDCALGWREQFNQVSAYIDGSPLYGSSARQSDKLRLLRNGMLQYGRPQLRRPLLRTEQKDELCRGGAVSSDCFKSGDARVNEHPGLVAAHIVWLRLHNGLAQELARLNPPWSDEKIYQETRKIVGAMIQHITYREFLPIVLGTEVMRLFELDLQRKGYFHGYSPKINPSPASSFGSAAFRFGHSLVQPSLMRFDRFHRPIPNNVSLHDELTNPSNIWSIGAVDRVIFGMVNQPIQKRDEYMTEELTNHLFQTPHFDFGMDLAAINIQRGRDHGVPPYTAWREPCGLSTITDFEDMVRVMPARVVRKLKFLYRHVDDVDLFTGGMAERPVVGGLVGPTFACVIAQQFSNLRKGDRFWYENNGHESSFTPAQLQQIRRISLAQVLCRTLDTIDSIQPFAFLSADNPDNGRISCSSTLMSDFDLSPWIEINLDSNNVRKSSDESIDEKPFLNKPSTKPTTTRPIKSTTATNLTFKRPVSTENNKTQKNSDELFFTEFNENENKHSAVELNLTVHKIDDKLDFQNKTLRYNDYDTDRHYTTKRYNDYDDEVQSIQSVVINNVSHKRPQRPYLSVTENIDKYTYLINYVPRPTQSWRQTTRRYYDRDVVKVTYQNYDDTYRRPNRPYYSNRDEFDNNFESRETDTKINGTKNVEGRSNDIYNFMTKHDQTTVASVKRNNNKITKENNSTKNEKEDITTEMYKLMTFSYLGDYKGMTNKNTDDKIKTEQDTVSKDFSTIESKNSDDNINFNKPNEKISTFFMYDTVTKSYNPLRPTRRDDVDDSKARDKYYYEYNVLRKYPNNDIKHSKEVLKNNNQNTKQNQSQHENIEERSRPSKINEDNATLKSSEKNNTKMKKPSPNQAKTPTVAFQIIPSEISPSQWAVYEEIEGLPDNLPYHMPLVLDQHALRELPRPMNLRQLGPRKT